MRQRERRSKEKERWRMSHRAGRRWRWKRRENAAVPMQDNYLERRKIRRKHIELLVEKRAKRGDLAEKVGSCVQTV